MEQIREKDKENNVNSTPLKEKNTAIIELLLQIASSKRIL